MTRPDASPTGTRAQATAALGSGGTVALAGITIGEGRRAVAPDKLHAELAEIDENLVRCELTVLERAEALDRRKTIYEALHPDAKPGVHRAAGMNQALGHDVDEIISPTFAADTAAMTGQSERSIQQEVQIARDVLPEVRDALRNTPIADRGKRRGSRGDGSVVVVVECPG